MKRFSSTFITAVLVGIAIIITGILLIGKDNKGSGNPENNTSASGDMHIANEPGATAVAVEPVTPPITMTEEISTENPTTEAPTEATTEPVTEPVVDETEPAEETTPTEEPPPVMMFSAT